MKDDQTKGRNTMEQGSGYVIVLQRVGDQSERVLQRAEDEATGRAYFEGYARDFRGKGERGEIMLRKVDSGEVIEKRQLRG